MAKKERIEIPKEVAAKVLFMANRTCCVCRQEGKPVQIHHVDDNPANNVTGNLAVLCFDCHRETQIQGGFDRKLDAEQVALFRDDWYALVSQRRAAHTQQSSDIAQASEVSLSLSTSIAEIYRENKEYELLATHYNSIGNAELRDKYIELALQRKPHDTTICYLRGLQNRPDLIPPDVLKRELKRYDKYQDHTERGRLLSTVGQSREAAISYVKGILRSLEDDNAFSAAYYIKELAEDGVLEQLFMLALKQAREEGDLWWQVRAMQELGWDEELHKLLLANRGDIEASDNPELQRLLADAIGDITKSIEIQKDMARNEHMVADGIELRTSIPIDAQIEKILSDQRALFLKKFGREPSRKDPVFFELDKDVPTPLRPETIRKQLLATMEAAAIPEGRRRELLKQMGFD